MDRTIAVKSYPAPSYNKREIFRYAGVFGNDNPPEEMEKIVDECIKECESVNAFSYKVSYRILPVLFKEENLIDFEYATLESADLKKSLSGCKECIFMAATVGHGIDRLIRKYSRTNAAKALFLQACGAERVEALCDAFCADEKIIPAGYKLRPRFSPGYGDLPLEFQKILLPLTDANKNLAITLNDSLLMSPSKSVTAIAGIVENQ